ncbi:hypothetical protein LguiB_019241 [Lonicera macranthoides]
MEQFDMNGGESDDRKKILSVKEAMDFYGERMREGNSSIKKPQLDFSEPTPRKKELHHARRDIGRFSDSRRLAESAKVRAESELNEAKKTVRDLSIRIEESNSKAKMQIRDLEKLKNPKRQQEWGLAFKNTDDDYQYAEVMRELKHIKQELSKLKLDMASVLEEKRKAEKESDASTSRLRSYSSSVEALKREIDELNEEHMLVELARIEALKESGAILAQRKEEAKRYSSAIEETREKVNGIIQEIDSSKELEMRLAVTTSDVNVLQNELALVKEMEDKRVQRNECLKNYGASFSKGDQPDSPSLLPSVSEELESAKKELAVIKEEGFQFMASMDIIRDELKHVTEETARLKKKEDKVDLTVQTLNSKLLRAKAKLESVSATEEKAKSIVSNLSLTLEQLKTEAEAAKKERELISEETAKIKIEVPKIESEIDMAEEKLQGALQELEAVKSKEAMALENLKNLIETTVRARASASQNSSKITITTFEYEYLQGRAAGAEEIADKKVAAAQAWIEALKANEKEILMKMEMAQREIREQRVEEEEEEGRERLVEGEFCHWGQNANLKNENLRLVSPQKIMNRNGIMTQARRPRYRKSFSPATRHAPRTSSLNAKSRKEGTPNLAKFFSGKNIERGL